MKNNVNIQRRKLLKFAGAGAVATAAFSTFPGFLNAKTMRVGSRPSLDFNPDIEIRLTGEVKYVSIFKGPTTRVWKVTGEVLKGDKTAITNDKESYLAPTIRLHKGQKVRIYLKNELPSATILHWHGLHVPAKMDGNPMYAIDNGETFVYEFEILNRAGTYWYHAHTHNLTAKHVYSGLAGFFIVSDDEEQALKLPRGEFDVPLVIQDRNFDQQNQLKYDGGMMQRMHGFLGEQILVNGRPEFKLPVETRAYRMRLLNGSNSRIYKLAWDDGTPIKVIATDGGLLERAETLPYLTLAPAERREIWVDFSGKEIGTELTLRSLEFSSGGMGMMGGMGGGMRGGRGGGMMGGMGGGQSHAGEEFTVLKVRVTKKSSSNDVLPKRLSKIPALSVADAENPHSPRRITLSMRHMSALLNGRSYKMNDIRQDEVVPVNTVQLMEFDNGFHGMGGMGMMGMSMPHPMHLHGEQFQVLKREVRSKSGKGYTSVSEGFLDKGWKDTVLVMPGEKVTILKPFNDYTGLFMYHCHNLEHEDMGMMRDLLVK
ncbi:bilirubin oxidase [Methyloprofundus sedimenti]|uniref:Multicopper oxidase CueO n=1 Tax=Methyloprofundus sedimenti TaxID=1420851 RepID=A0A1V8M8V0_9GAMM|nr:multicopper oxidase family protein [Methyloprofundus sedimenti]OQK17948.1 bilirubin oxidase [Methyloprofundus sedimenti]